MHCSSCMAPARTARAYSSAPSPEFSAIIIQPRRSKHLPRANRNATRPIWPASWCSTVTAVETEEGRRWAESKIKALTGGDKISARFMRQDFFEFVPNFKLVIAGNHKPGLRSVDEAIRRRLHLIPFSVTILPAERDLDLAEKLKAEWPGILAWMIDGCLKWQATGLQPPAAVTDATAAYLAAEDATGAWMDECCERDPSAWAANSTLFASWTVWAAKAGEPIGSQKRFVQSLEARGLEPRREKSIRGFRGSVPRVPRNSIITVSCACVCARVMCNTVTLVRR